MLTHICVNRLIAVNDCKMLPFLLDSKVLNGTTSGEAVFEDQREIISLTTGEGALYTLFDVTDTTGSMGTLGACFWNNTLEHGYYVDHILHSNVILALNGG